jgi:cytochrome P450 family 4
MGYRWRKLIKIARDFTESIIRERRHEIARNPEKFSLKNDEDIGVKKKLALLDILLQSTVDGKPLSDSDIREEVDTFAFAGHDTTSSAMSFCCFTLAKHPEVQQKVFEEIRSVIGDDKNKSITIQDLNNLNYLERVIKETLRMYPPVAVFGRKIKEDVTISRENID